MKGSYAVVSIVAYIDLLKTSLKYECCVPHFTFRNRSFFLSGGGGGGRKWDLLGVGGMKKYRFKEGGGQEKHMTYWV